MSKNTTPPTLSQDSLQSQYPSLDPSLIAAFLTEFDIKQQKQLTQLHETLASLCSPVDDAQSLSSALEKASLTSSSSVSDIFNDTYSSPTSSSNNSLASFSTPLGFLQNLFPDIDSDTLQSTLDEHGPDNLESIIDILLSNDLIRDLQETGGWTDGDLSSKQALAPESVEQWAKVTKAQRDPTPPAPTTPTRKAKTKAKTKGKQQPSFVLGVVRHGQLPPHRSAPISSSSSTVVDPWTYIDSVATRLNAILPNSPSSVFSSAFHNPRYSTPADALRATLANLGNTNTVDDFALGALVSLLDDESGDLFDANLCLRASASQPDDAYHLIEILKELDEKAPVVAHYTTLTAKSPVKEKPNLPTGPPELPPPQSPSRYQSTASEAAKSPVSPAKPVWGTVPTRPKAKTVGTSYSQGASIPGSSGWSTAVGMDNVEQGGVDENDADACIEMAIYWKEKRHAALKQASEVYTRQKHEYGGEAALFYSNQAKDYSAKEREWRLKAAKAGVKAKQDRTSSKAIDLHGLTVHESLEVVKEAVNTWWSSAGSASTPREPLQIITGRGLHSKGNVPVIAPAVMKLLERDGWKAHKREGTVYVTGIFARR